MLKSSVMDLAVFGGQPVFSSVRHTSNLVQPDVETYFRYAKRSYEAGISFNTASLVQKLEKRLSDLHKNLFCVTFCSGFMALMLAMDVLSIKGKQEVIMPSLTYRRMADIAAWAGLVPHFCDVDERSLGMTAHAVETCINNQTALILGVHPITNLCDVEGLEQLAEKHGIPLLFDSVEAGYASLNGQMIGSFGDAEVFSMHASKLINGFEGGYIITSDPKIKEMLKKARAFGFYGNDRLRGVGINAKLNDIHAAMALACLDDLDSQIERNKTRHRAYRKHLRNINGLTVLPYDDKQKRSFKNVLVKITDQWPLSREQTLKILHAENMLARPYYFPSLHARATEYETRQSIYMQNTKKLSLNHILLPCGDFVSLEDIAIISDILIFLQNNGKEIRKNL